jgi:hypothetical protein
MDDVILSELVYWCKIFIYKRLNGNVIFKRKSLILNNAGRERAGDSSIKAVDLLSRSIWFESRSGRQLSSLGLLLVVLRLHKNAMAAQNSLYV